MFPKDSLEDMMKPGREAFEYWISFWPTAPMFGVEWRFGNMMPGMDKMMPGMDKMMPGMVAMMPAMQAFMPQPPVAKKPNPAAAAPAAAPAKPAAEATPAPKPKPAPSNVAAVADEEPAAKPAVRKTAAKKATAKPAVVEKTAPVKAEKPAPKAKAKAAPKTKAKAKTKDGKPSTLMVEKPAQVDDLKMIKGVGPGLERELNALGVYQFSQMAGFSKDDLTWIDSNLTAFKGRCFRDDWIGQAKALMG